MHVSPVEISKPDQYATRDSLSEDKFEISLASDTVLVDVTI